MKITAIRTICWIGACAILCAAPVRAGDDKGYVFVYLGGFQTGETTTVLDDSQGGGVLGAGWGWRFHRLLTFELDASSSSTEYDQPPPTSRSDLDGYGLTLSTTGVCGNLKLGGQLGRVRPHAGVGLGGGLIDVSLSGPATWFEEPLESQFSLLTQMLAGFDIRVSRKSHLGVEYRKLFAHRTITFDGEEVDGGGESFVLAYRFGL